MISIIVIILILHILFHKPTVVIVSDEVAKELIDDKKKEKETKCMGIIYFVCWLIVIILTITFAYKFWHILSMCYITYS